MNVILLFVLIVYFSLIYFVAYLTGKNSNSKSFYIGNKNNSWFLVAFGMIGTSLSGVTFISVPGLIQSQGFTYFQITLGYFIGYLLIAFILIPAYYKYNVTSIYKFLEIKLGASAYKTGSLFFIISRALGSCARLFLVVNILQYVILDSFKIPFTVTAILTLALIWLYTQKGGVKTIIWTDLLQTLCMLFGLFFCIFYILHSLHLNFTQAWHYFSPFNQNSTINNTWFNTDFNSSNFWGKQILAGILIALTMTGMDQEMMQKNISVKTLKEAKINMVMVGVLISIVILVFLILGGILQLYVTQNNLVVEGDRIFPTVVMGYLPAFMKIIFIIALISALFPSADGALTALTSSFCLDIIKLPDKNISETTKTKYRKKIHLLFTIIFFILIIIFKIINNNQIINTILQIAGYTYGPILGLFVFSITVKRVFLKQNLVYLICILSPIVTFLINHIQNTYFEYKIGLEIILINGLLTFFGLFIISTKPLKS